MPARPEKWGQAPFREKWCLSPFSGQFVLVRRQLLRNRRRTALTLLGLAVSFFLYTSLETVLETLERIVDRTASDTIVFARPRHEVSFVSAGLPRRYIAEVREVDGVTAATPLRFVFARGRSENLSCFPSVRRGRAR